MRLAKFILSLALLLVGREATALSLEPGPICEADGLGYYLVGDYAGGITMAKGISSAEKPGWLILAQCQNNKQLRMMIRMNAAKSGFEPDYSNASELAIDRVIEMIASAEAYSFGDVANQLSDLIVLSETSPLSPDHCICTVERN